MTGICSDCLASGNAILQIADDTSDQEPLAWHAFPQASNTSSTAWWPDPTTFPGHPLIIMKYESLAKEARSRAAAKPAQVRSGVKSGMPVRSDKAR